MLRVVSSISHGRNLDKIATLSDTDIVVRSDTFTQQDLDEILQKGKPKYFVSDVFSEAYFDNIDVVGLPLFASAEIRRIASASQFDRDFDTDVTFNFMINKKQINRFLCVKLVECFDLKDFDYTWSGTDVNFEMSGIIRELDSLQERSPLNDSARTCLLQPISLSPRFIPYPGQRGDSSQISNYGGNTWTWNNGLQDMFSKSAVSLISESVGWQRASIFSEKTLFAVLGLTFPIWVGGYQQAQEFQNIGFDTFDDIIDHSYQHYDTLIERCYYAVEKNLSVLSNLALAAELRQKNKHRLLANRDFLLQDGVTHFVNKKITTLPADLQQAMPEIFNHLRYSNQ